MGEAAARADAPAAEWLVPLAPLAAAGPALGADYAAARPFPHVALVDLWREEVLDRIDREFPEPGRRDWLRWESEHESKETSKGIENLSPFTQEVFRQLNAEPFLKIVRSITGLSDLVPDPTFFGAGLHEAFRGGWLDIHSDYLRHPHLPLARRVNLLVYLNRGWKPEWSGDLELWDAARERREAHYAPVFNRTVIFGTTRQALHGHPTPLSCPVGRSRRLMSVYYWSADPALFDQTPDVIWLNARGRAGTGGWRGLLAKGKRLLGPGGGRR